jgi:hypothetical protein
MKKEQLVGTRLPETVVRDLVAKTFTAVPPRTVENCIGMTTIVAECCRSNH